MTRDHAPGARDPQPTPQWKGHGSHSSNLVSTEYRLIIRRVNYEYSALKRLSCEGAVKYSLLPLIHSLNDYRSAKIDTPVGY